MPQNKIHQAAQNGDLNKLKQLVDPNPELANNPIKLLCDRDSYPLEDALCNQHYDCAIYLLEHGADPSIQYSFSANRSTPLHNAAEHCILPVILLLLYFNADTTCKDLVGITPLQRLNFFSLLQRHKLTLDDCNKFIEDFKQLDELKTLYIAASKNNKITDQKNLAVEIGNIYMRTGNEIIRYPQGEQYYLAIAQFFYKKAISYYSFVADSYYKHLNEKDFDKSKYINIAVLLSNLHHRAHNFELRDYYDKQLLLVDPGYQRSNEDIAWRKITTIETQPSNNPAFFWASPAKIFNSAIQKISGCEIYKSWRNTH